MPLKRNKVGEAFRLARFEETKRDASSTLAHSVLRTMERNYVDLY
jgi:hypothetical protein